MTLLIPLAYFLNSDEAKRPNFIELDDDIKVYRSDIRAKAVSYIAFPHYINLYIELRKKH